jgi:DNA-binding ferritin-like protein (Dps family)
MFDKALDLFEEMSFDRDEVIETIVFQACAHLSNDRAQRIGKKLLQQMPANLDNDRTLTSAIHMLMKFGDVKSAEDIFEQSTKKNIFTYGAMMQGNILRCIFNHNCFNLGYVENKMFEKTLDLFEQLSLNPDRATYIIVLNACAHLSNDRSKELGKKLLEQMPNSLRNHINIRNIEIHMLMRFGDVQGAEDLFALVKKKDVITYGTMMKGKMLSCIFNYN